MVHQDDCEDVDEDDRMCDAFGIYKTPERDEFQNDQGSQDEIVDDEEVASASEFSSFAYEDSEQLNQKNMARAKKKVEKVGTMFKMRQSSKSKSLSKKEKIE